MRQTWTRKAKSFAWLACLLVLFGCKIELYSGLSEREATEMVAILLSNGIDSYRELRKDGEAAVFIDKEYFSDAVLILKNEGYPREKFANMGDVFRQDGLVSSPRQERARFVYALSQELSDTLSQIVGVLSARVHVVLPDNDPFRQELQPSSASVFIRHLDNVDLAMLVPEIKNLVTNGIEGLDYDNVSVALFPSPPERISTFVRPLMTFLGVRVHPDSYALAVTLILAGYVLALIGGAFGCLMYVLHRRDSSLTTLVKSIRS